MITCTKRYDDFPFAHRQHTHGGHCRFIHGHNWSFEFTFAARTLDECGFVIDFGSLGWLKDYLREQFDHKLLLNDGDPFADYLTGVIGEQVPVPHRAFQFAKLADICIVDDASCEGLADMLFDVVSGLVRDKTDGRVWLVRVTVYEDSKNSATCAKETTQ